MIPSLVLGLIAAVGWGLADFLARFAARRVGAYRSLFFMQGFGVLVLTVYMAVAGGVGRFFSGAGGQVWLWLIVAGLLNVVSGLALYHSFEVGVLAIVAPISSSYPALTMILAVWSGEIITRVRASGIVGILVGVALAATSFASGSGAHAGAATAGDRKLARGVGWAITAAAGFGIVFWLLGFHVMPVMGSVVSVWVIRATTFVTQALAAAPLGQTLRMPRGRILWLLAAVGLFDTGAFVVNNVGLKSGQVSLVTVIASLYSAVTVLLAWIFLRERMAWNQWLGIVLIFAGIVLVSI